MKGMEELLQATGRGDRAMQQVIREWKKYQPDSVNEAIRMGKEMGLKEGIHQGIRQGRDETSCEIAERMIRDGMSDRDIGRLTRLTMEDIARLRNGAR